MIVFHEKRSLFTKQFTHAAISRHAHTVSWKCQMDDKPFDKKHGNVRPKLIDYKTKQQRHKNLKPRQLIIRERI